jgi:SAM-dependent methyltransferase
MLVETDRQTLSVATRSLETAWRQVRGAERDDTWCVETLGLHEEEKETLRRQLREAPGHVDPAARFLVGATNGMMYRHLIGHLASYPIPEIRLEAASNRTLLDIGCNWGRWCVAAARLGYRPIGIDPSLGAVLAARRVCLQFKISAEFVVGDARFLPFRENSLENVFSYSVLQHFPKNEATTAFAEAWRVLRIGGVGMVQMANRAGLRCLYHQIRRGFREPRNFEVRYWGIEEMRRMLMNIGADASFSVDCFFGIGLQANDIALMSARQAAVIRCSERLRSWSMRLPLLTRVADSVYVRFKKPREGSQRST